MTQSTSALYFRAVFSSKLPVMVCSEHRFSTFWLVHFQILLLYHISTISRNVEILKPTFVNSRSAKLSFKFSFHQFSFSNTFIYLLYSCYLIKSGKSKSRLEIFWCFLDDLNLDKLNLNLPVTIWWSGFKKNVQKMFDNLELGTIFKPLIKALFIPFSAKLINSINPFSHFCLLIVNFINKQAFFLHL